MFSDFTMEELNRERASETEKELKTESEAGRENRVREGSARSSKQIHLPEAFQEAQTCVSNSANVEFYQHSCQTDK